MKKCKDCRTRFDPEYLRWASDWTNFMKGIGAWDSLCEGCLDTKCEMLAPGFEGDYLDDRLLLAGLKMEIESRDPRKFSHRSEAELLDAVERLAWQGVNAKRVADLLETSLPVEEFEDWLACDAEHKIILSWAKTGLDLEAAQEWMEWAASPTVARKLKKATGWKSDEEDWPPSSEWRDYGFSLEEAMVLKKAWFDPAEMEGWSTLGLSAAQIIDLRNQVVREHERSPDRFHTIFGYRPDSSTNWERSSDFPFWYEVRKSLEGLRDAKLPLTLSNVLTYGWMSGDQILSAIDSPEELSVALPFAQEGLSATEISTAARFVEKGFDIDEAMSLASGGATANDVEYLSSHRDIARTVGRLLSTVEALTLSDALAWIDVNSNPEVVKKLIASGIARDRFKAWKDKGYSLNAMLEFIEQGWSERDAASWMKVHFTPSDAAIWVQHGLNARDAVKWRGGGFSAANAVAWIKAGAADPEIAARRRKAGVDPT